MTWRKPNPAHNDDGVGTNLVAECEAFISGAYAAHLQARGQPVPAWAWINRLAHAAPADIEVLAAAAYGDTPEALTSCIAAHLLAVTQHRGISLESNPCNTTTCSPSSRCLPPMSAKHPLKTGTTWPGRSALRSLNGAGPCRSTQTGPVYEKYRGLL